MRIKTEPIDPLNLPKTDKMMKEWQAFKDEKFVALEEKVKELLLFTQNNGTVINGFRTEGIIKELKEMVAW
jgi:hypothetical protein